MLKISFIRGAFIPYSFSAKPIMNVMLREWWRMLVLVLSGSFQSFVKKIIIKIRLEIKNYDRIKCNKTSFQRKSVEFGYTRWDIDNIALNSALWTLSQKACFANNSSNSKHQFESIRCYYIINWYTQISSPKAI